MTAYRRVGPERVAEIATRPLNIVVTGLTAAVTLAIGAPLALVGGAAVLAGAAGTAVGLRAMGEQVRTPAPKVKLSPRWAAHVNEARDAHRRYLQAVADVPDDGLRDELDRIGASLAEGVTTSERIAARGQQLDAALEKLPEAKESQRQLAALRAQGVGHDDPRWTAAAYQRDTVERVTAQRDEVEAKLAMLDAQLESAIVSAIEAGLAADASQVRLLGDRVDSAVDELHTLNQALGEVEGIG